MFRIRERKTLKSHTGIIVLFEGSICEGYVVFRVNALWAGRVGGDKLLELFERKVVQLVGEEIYCQLEISVFLCILSCTL